jgi:hypothetical protein
MDGSLRRLRLALVLTSILAAAVCAGPPKVGPPEADPEAAYDVREAQGVRVLLNRRLPPNERAVAFQHLDEQLAEVVRLVPVGYHRVLRDATVWVEAGSPVWVFGASGRRSDVQYFQLDGADVRKYGAIAAKAGSIEVFAAWRLTERWASWVNEITPGWLLHEVVHALHDRVLGFDHAGVKEAYRQAVERKLYDEVETRQYLDYGRYETRRGPAYARTNHMEYFAELSATYLGLRSTFFPFTRDELQKHDSAGYAQMEDVWRSAEYLVASDLRRPVTLYQLGANDRRFRIFDLAPGRVRLFDAWGRPRLLAVEAGTGKEYRLDAPKDADGVWRLNPAGAESAPPPY